MIDIKNLSFAYDGTFALEDINLGYDKKDFLAIIGPNGGGKSTLLKLILGILTPKSGEILVFGKKPSDVAKLIGYVPQFIPINNAFPITVLEVVLMGRIDKKHFLFYTKEDKAEALNALRIVGIEELADKRISTLSGGQRQRAYIARALCSKAELLLLDEPTASIDIRGQIEIYELLKKLNQNGIGIVLISHDINTAIVYATKVAHVSKRLTMHNIDINAKDNFFKHLVKDHGHFCDVELILRECSCKSC